MAESSSTSNIIITTANTQGATIGTVVAFDPSQNLFVPAQPRWKRDLLTSRIIPDPLAYIAGIVYSTPDASGVASLLLTGAVEPGAMGQDFPSANGEYYLGPDGTLVESAALSAGSFPIYCGYCVGGTFIFRPDSPAYAGHQHTQYTLSGGSWSGSNGVWTYDYTNDTTCAQILNSLPLTSIVAICDNMLIKNLTVSDSSIVFNTGAETQPTVSLYGINPFSTIVPEVTSIAPAQGNTVLKVTQAYGTVYLDTDFATTGTTFEQYTGTCITNFSRSGVSTGPVVQEILPGAGVDIVPNSDYPGSYTINASWLSKYIDMQTINANNVLVGSTATDALITFPAGINSTLIGVVRVPASENDWTINVFAWMLDAGGSLTGSILIQPPPSGSAAVSTTTSISLSGSGNVGSITEALSADTYTVPGDSLVTITLNATAPGIPIQLRALGVKLNTNAD